MKVLEYRPSPSMVVALLALIVALAGTAYAAVSLPKNSVGAKQIKKNAVSGAKVDNGSLSVDDFASDQIPQGPKGDPGTPGTDGVTQVIVRRRPGDVTIANPAGSSVDLISTTLPAGKWEISATTNALYDGAPDANFRCSIFANGQEIEPARVLALGSSTLAARAGIFTAEAAVTSDGLTIVKLSCNHEQETNTGAFGPKFASSRLSAIRADTLDVQNVTG